MLVYDDREQSCQCEHTSHFHRADRTPNGNPGHSYGQRFLHVVHITTTYGKLAVCQDCADDCHQEVRND